MIDAGPWILFNAGAKEFHQIGESFLFCIVVMRPKRFEFIVKPEAMKIFQAVFVMWIALNVVEDVTLGGLRQQIEPPARLDGP